MMSSRKEGFGMSTRTQRGLILGLAVAGVAVVFSAALILKVPGPGPVTAAADAESVTIATRRLEVALGVPRGTVKTTGDPGAIPGAVQSFEWSNGRAGMDASGKIVMVILYLPSA